MASGSISEVVAVLADAFTTEEVTSGVLSELKRTLPAYVSKNRRGDGETTNRLQDELLTLYKREIEPCPSKLGLFMTVLKHLGPALKPEEDIVHWFHLAVKSFVQQPDSTRCSIEDAREFVVQAMVYDDEAPDAHEKASTCAKLAKILIDAYMVLSYSPSTASEPHVPAKLKSQATQQLQSMLIAFGRRKAQDLFLAIDNYLVVPEARFRALVLLGAFVQQQHAHLHLVVHTAIIEHLLKCLMNDTATVVVSAALRNLIMLLPHIPTIVATQLPRLFLVYSRCLCWEKFSTSSTKAQRDLVTDERVRRGSDSDHSDDSDMDSDPSWTILRTVPDMPESSAPELLHYFTHLYALYPLNFTTYIRKPRKYLKNLNFPGADDFDLDQTVIRSRTEQFQRLHLLHSNFFTSTIEDELTDNRWLKAEPSEIIAECHALYVGQQVTLSDPGPPPGPPPNTELPALPNLPALTIPAASRPPPDPFEPISPSHVMIPASPLHSTESAAGSPTDSTLGQKIAEDKRPPDIGDTASIPNPALEDTAHLQRELMLLQNELTFEKYLKQQHVAAIAQLRRNHIKAVTIEAETATLINANRALQKKLGDANKFNEKMQKETQARRTHTQQSEEQLTAKIRSLKNDLVDQESLQRDLQQATKECEQLRQLLVESEARELGKQDQLDLLQAKAQDTERLHREVSDLTRQLRMHRQHQVSFETTEAEQQMTEQKPDSARLLPNQKERGLDATMQAYHNRIAELDKSNTTYRDRLAELEAHLQAAEGGDTTSMEREHMRVVAELRATLADARSKLAHTKKVYARLLHDHTNLTIKYQELVADVGLNMDSLATASVRPHDQNFGIDYQSQDRSTKNYSLSNDKNTHYPQRGQDQVSSYTTTTSFPQPGAISANTPPPRPIRPDAYLLPRSESATFSDRTSSSYSTASWLASPSMTNMSDHHHHQLLFAPGMKREHSQSVFSFNSEDSRSSSAGTGKLKTKPEARVHGRGGAQNNKVKGKDKVERGDKLGKKGGLSGLRGFI